MDEELAELLKSKILPLFRNSNPDIHPWWWPKRTGEEFSDWFSGYIKEEELKKLTGLSKNYVIKSLRGGMSGGKISQHVKKEFYENFKGFWGDVTRDRNLIVLISDRPSRGLYPQASCTRLMSLLKKLALEGVHLTDFIKRRGERSSNKDLPLGEGICDHVDILLEEIKILATHHKGKICLVPSRDLALQYLINCNIKSKLENILGRGCIGIAKKAPRFWSGTNWNKDEIVKSWKQAIKEATE